MTGTGEGSASLLTEHTGPRRLWLGGVLSSLQPQTGPAVVILGGCSLGRLFSLRRAPLLSSFRVAFLVIVSSTPSSLLSRDGYVQSHRFFSIEPSWLLDFSTCNFCWHPLSFLPLPVVRTLASLQSIQSYGWGPWVSSLMFSHLSSVTKMNRSGFSLSHVCLPFSAWSPAPAQASILLQGCWRTLSVDRWVLSSFPPVHCRLLKHTLCHSLVRDQSVSQSLNSRLHDIPPAMIDSLLVTHWFSRNAWVPMAVSCCWPAAKSGGPAEGQLQRCLFWKTFTGLLVCLPPVCFGGRCLLNGTVSWCFSSAEVERQGLFS